MGHTIMCLYHYTTVLRGMKRIFGEKRWRHMWPLPYKIRKGMGMNATWEVLSTWECGREREGQK